MSNAWAGEPFKIMYRAPEGTGTAVPADQVIFTSNVWTQPGTNTHVQTFTVTVDAGYVPSGIDWFRMGAYVGVGYTGLFVSTGNIRVAL